MHTKGYAAPETRAALDQARALIENANALGEPPEDPLLLFSNLYGFWVSNYNAFDGDVIRALARKFLVLAEERGASVPLMIAHRIMGCSLASTGGLVEARVHLDCAVHFTILRRTARWRLDLAKTTGLRLLRMDQLLFGCLVIPMQHTLMQRVQ